MRLAGIDRIPSFGLQGALYSQLTQGNTYEWEKGPAMAQKSKTSNYKRVHVISTRDRWAVLKEGNSRASKIYDTKSAAEKRASEISNGGDVVIHRRDGTVQKWIRAK